MRQQQHETRQRNARYRMYLMLACQGATNWVPKLALASHLPLVAAARGWDNAQRAVLLSAFPPCYLITQLPGSILIQRVGAKLVLTINMLGTALILLALPAVDSVVGMAALLGAMGLLQGPFIPAWQTLQRNWMPQGSERVWARRFVGQGNNASNVLAPTLTPFLAVNFGWRSVPLVYAAAVGTFAVYLLWGIYMSSESFNLALFLGTFMTSTFPGVGTGTSQPPSTPLVACHLSQSSPRLQCQPQRRLYQRQRKRWSGVSSRRCL